MALTRSFSTSCLFFPSSAGTSSVEERPLTIKGGSSTRDTPGWDKTISVEGPHEMCITEAPGIFAISPARSEVLLRCPTPRLCWESR